MKIAVLVYGLDGLGGIAKHVLYNARELVELGHSVDIYAVEYDPDRCYPEIARNLNITALRRPKPQTSSMTQSVVGGRMLNYMMGLWRAWRDQKQLVARVADGYDIINPHGFAIHWAALYYKEAHGTPITWLCYDFWPMAHQPISAEASPLTQWKQRLKRALAWPFDRLDRRAVDATDEIIVLSESVRDPMFSHYGVQSTIIRPGVSRSAGDGTPDELRQRYGLGQNTFVLLTVCMLMPRRRLEDVITAVRQLVDAGYDISYIIAGSHAHSPDYVATIQQQICSLGLEDRVKLTGEVPEGELGSYFAGCEGFIWPADENQSWGMACMEAMLFGKPVLVSAANGLAEVLDDGEHALVFEPRSTEAIVGAITRLMNDAELREKLSKQGQTLVRDNYSWRGNAKAILKVFDRALGQSQPVDSARTTAIQVEQHI